MVEWRLGSGTIGDVTKRSADELGRILRQAQDDMMRKIEDELSKQTFFGGRRITVQPLPEVPADVGTTVHRVKVGLYGSKPPIWRRIEIPSSTPLDVLHEILQVAFGWYGLHLHLFETVYGQFGLPDEEDDWDLGLSAPRRDEGSAVLGQVAAAEKAKVVYTYDFGDDWRHDIVVEAILPAEPGVAYPRCTGGRRPAPPEDCGGTWAWNQSPPTEDSFDPDEVSRQLAEFGGILVQHAQHDSGAR